VSAGKQTPTGANAVRPALMGSLAGPLDMLGLTDPVAEVGLEFLRYRGQVLRFAFDLFWALSDFIIGRLAGR